MPALVLNLNDKARVRLTEAGADWYHAHSELLGPWAGSYDPRTRRLTLCLWQLFLVFGRAMDVGPRHLFDENDLEVPWPTL